MGEDEDRRLLAKAIKLAEKSEFVEMREDFYQWWSDVSASGISVSVATDDMEKRITEYQKLVATQDLGQDPPFQIEMGAFGLRGLRVSLLRRCVRFRASCPSRFSKTS